MEQLGEGRRRPVRLSLRRVLELEFFVDLLKRQICRGRGGFDVVSEDVDTFEEDLVECAPYVGWRTEVAPLPVVGQRDRLVDGGTDVVGADLGSADDFAGVGPLLFDACLLGAEHLQAEGIVLVGDGVLEFLLVQTLEARLLGLEDLGVVVVESLEFFTQETAKPSEAIGSQPDAVVTTFDLGFDVIDGEVGHGAGAELASSAHEVRIEGAMAVLGHGQVEPELAFSAVDRALEVMLVDAVLDARSVPGGQELLDLLEDVLVDQWLVFSGVLLTLVDDPTEVVAVAEHLVDLVLVERAREVDLAVGLGAKPAFVEFFSQATNGPVARGVGLKGPTHVGCAFVVDDDLRNASPAASAGFAHVQIANGWLAGSAPELRLLEHAHLDAAAGHTNLELGEHGQHAFGQPLFGAIAHYPFGR